jgi:phosphoribosyl 1,2-cyclic phosphodiesterase
VEIDNEGMPFNPPEQIVPQGKRDSKNMRLDTNHAQAGQEFNLTVCMLASGSRGNALFVSGGSTSILIDAGLSGIQIERRLRSRGLFPEELDAILVSHEHTDHIQGAGVLSRRYNLPVYMNIKTRKAAELQMRHVHGYKNFECGSTFMIKDLIIHPFSISHDAEDPAGFTVNQNGTKIGVATDLGVATSVVKNHLKGCVLLVLEANHDEAMLINGPYPWSIKQRIRSRTGHLSNTASKNLLKEVQHDHLKYVMLAHLSETNNTPQKALNEVGKAITHSNVQLYVAKQDACGKLLHLK